MAVARELADFEALLPRVPVPVVRGLVGVAEAVVRGFFAADPLARVPPAGDPPAGDPPAGGPPAGDPGAFLVAAALAEVRFLFGADALASPAAEPSELFPARLAPVVRDVPPPAALVFGDVVDRVRSFGSAGATRWSSGVFDVSSTTLHLPRSALEGSACVAETTA